MLLTYIVTSNGDAKDLRKVIDKLVVRSIAHASLPTVIQQYPLKGLGKLTKRHTKVNFEAKNSID